MDGKQISIKGPCKKSGPTACKGLLTKPAGATSHLSKNNSPPKALANFVKKHSSIPVWIRSSEQENSPSISSLHALCMYYLTIKGCFSFFPSFDSCEIQVSTSSHYHGPFQGKMLLQGTPAGFMQWAILTAMHATRIRKEKFFPQLFSHSCSFTRKKYKYLPFSKIFIIVRAFILNLWHPQASFVASFTDSVFLFCNTHYSTL